MSDKNELVIYQSDELTSRIEVRIEDETIWLTQNQIVEPFDSSKANISEHIKNIFETNELDDVSTVRKSRTVHLEGDREVSRELLHYSLDVILSVGYRVNSKRGAQIFNKAHDRFLIIDDTTVYHFGASLKDLGKKWFAFSRMDFLVNDILKRLNVSEIGILI